jgi:diaminohydroxyphosphoribosylaminopyrimidine deaminase/5-amino-6-(5-phosphoribosylamino)uracil reductase
MALKLARKGYGFVNPNPLVGAVLVKNGQVIGKGYHGYFGGPHAEINAIEKAKTNVEGATLYVNLEPCNHHGKTPPCADRIIDEKIDRVVIGMKDPNKMVKGHGAGKLREAGIEITTGILEDEVQKLNEVYIKYIQNKIPFCAMKTAMTLDGKIATYRGDSKWITNELSREYVHELRHRYAAIMVGVNTVITDNPFLNDRSKYKRKKHPVKIIVDSLGSTPKHSNIFNNEAETIIAVTKNATVGFRRSMAEKGVRIIECPEKNHKVDLRFLMEKLGDMGIDSILLEGGSTLNFSAIQEGIVDKVYSFISPRLIGGSKSLTPMGGNGFEKIEDAINLKIESIRKFEEDLMIEAYVINN